MSAFLVTVSILCMPLFALCGVATGVCCWKFWRGAGWPALVGAALMFASTGLFIWLSLQTFLWAAP